MAGTKMQWDKKNKLLYFFGQHLLLPSVIHSEHIPTEALTQIFTDAGKTFVVATKIT